MKTYRYLPFAFFAVMAAMLNFSCQKPAAKQEADTTATATAPNTLSADEKATGWELLFDGSTLKGWKRYNQDSIGPLWSVKDGAIVCDGRGLGEGSDHGGSLSTLQQWGNFELSVDWKISPGGNSGILYHVVEQPQFKQSYETGPEYQVLDDNGWKDPLTDAQKAGSNYDMHPAPSNKKINPAGEWNSARIVYNNGHVEHWLNGDKILEFEEGSADFADRYKKSKWIGYPRLEQIQERRNFSSGSWCSRLFPEYQDQGFVSMALLQPYNSERE